MNPCDEQRLRDEVIYLHSLWHRGPPNRHQTHNPRTTLHIPTDPTLFKKQKPDSGPEWPDSSPPSSTTTAGWPELKPKAPKEPVSEQDQAKLLALQVQNKAVDGCRRFLSERVDEEESDEEEDDDSTEYRFLLDIFVNDDKLREYYEKNHESGEFCCLICGGIGEKLNKRYKDCVGLVQHANGVSKTKRKRAHRALGRVVCTVLGWDFDRLPVVVLKGQPLGTSLAISQGEEAKGNADNDKLNEGSMTENNSELVERELLNVSQKGGEMKSFLKVDDSSKCVEIVDAKVSNMEADKEIAVECKESSPSLVASNSWSHIEPVDELYPIASGWPTLKPRKPLTIQLASAEDQAKLAAVKLQHKVAEACQNFFEENAGSKGDEDDDEEEDYIMDEDDDGDEHNLIDKDESEDSEDFKFFLNIFSENSELRNYYEKNFKAGEFCCLVCSGIGKKVWKRFKDCLGLLQHSTAISKTKKRHAHRAFGQVVCKVLGWDIDWLPTIVSKGEPLGQSLAKLGVLQGEVEKNAESIEDEITAPKNHDDCELDRNRGSYFRLSNDTLIDSKNPSRKDDSIKDINDNPAILDVEGNKEGTTGVLVPQENDGIAN